MLRFYNTLTRKLEEFKEIEKGHVKLYTCGPTVYNVVHIGNFRTFVFEDILRRYLKYKGYKVTQVMNLTDVDDKTIKGAKHAGLSLNEFTEKYTQLFFEDRDALGIEPAEIYPKATDHISEMVTLIKTLVANGYTYESDGSIYFKLSKFPSYGKLSKIDVENMKSGTRYDADEYDKQDVRDFVLWKGYKDGDPFWETEIGKGRPGWHIECSAMSMKYLGESFDIHTGGIDNMFPHHENEIAQSEAATGKPFVHYWLHSEYLMMKDAKMAKSAGNFLTIRDLITKGINPMVIRYFLISAHYRSQLIYSEDNLVSAENGLKRLNECISNITQITPAPTENSNVDEIIKQTILEFEESMDDDLNICCALAAIFNMIKTINGLMVQNKIGLQNKQTILDTLTKFNSVFGVMNFKNTYDMADDEINQLIAERDDARKNKNFKRSDEIRDFLKSKGIVLKDTKDGVRFARS